MNGQAGRGIGRLGRSVVRFGRSYRALRSPRIEFRGSKSLEGMYFFTVTILVLDFIICLALVQVVHMHFSGNDVRCCGGGLQVNNQ